MDLSREARALLDSAQRADAAPLGARQRVRHRFVTAVATGTISAFAAAAAKGASLNALGTAAQASTTVAASTSVVATWVGAAVTGLALGMVVLSPASKIPDETAVKSTAASVGPERVAPSTPIPGRIAASAPNESLQLESQVSPALSQPASTGARMAPARVADERLNDKYLPGLAAMPLNAASLDTVALSGSTRTLDSVGVMPPSKASIARETELLAGVQRAIQQGRPASALAMLNRYDKEFPAGALREEAIASRVVALCDFGRGDDAARWRAEFFRRYPNSALSARVRAACSASQLPGTTAQGAPK